MPQPGLLRSANRSPDDNPTAIRSVTPIPVTHGRREAMSFCFVRIETEDGTIVARRARKLCIAVAHGAGLLVSDVCCLLTPQRQRRDA
jgi:hypothetical protein